MTQSLSVAPERGDVAKEQQSLHVLVVDDDQDVRNALSELLQYSGYDVATAENGQVALAAAKELKPELVLMDIRMPVLDGLAAIQIMKNTPDTQTIPIIVMSGVANAQSFDHARVVADESIAKPLDFNELLEKVRRLLDQ